MARFIESFIFYILIVFFQIILFDNTQVSGYLNIIIYPLFLILFPINISRVNILFLGALLGVTADAINSSSGVYSITFILLGYLRPFLLRIFTKSDLIDSPSMPLSGVLGDFSFLKFLFVLMFIMFTIVTFLERLTLNNIDIAMLKIVISTVVSTFTIYLLQLPLNKLNKNTWV